MIDFDSFENSIGYRFVDRSRASAALHHASTRKTGLHEGLNSETLEFLGDAVLGLIIGHELMKRRSDLNEGDLSRWRSSLVSKDALAEIALSLSVNNYIKLGPAEMGSEGGQKPSILSHALEALIGAIYLDGGFYEASAVVLNWYDPSLRAGYMPQDFDPKTCLQEWAQSRGSRPDYELVEQGGKAHAKTFTYAAVIDGTRIGTGAGASKKKASIAAARDAIDSLKKEGLLGESVANWSERVRPFPCVDS